MRIPEHVCVFTCGNKFPDHLKREFLPRRSSSNGVFPAFPQIEIDFWSDCNPSLAAEAFASSSPNPPATNPTPHMSKRNWRASGPDYTLADSIVWIRVHEKATGSTRLFRGCTLSCRTPRPRIPFSPSLALPHSPRPACITHAASCVIKWSP